MTLIVDKWPIGLLPSCFPPSSPSIFYPSAAPFPMATSVFVRSPAGATVSLSLDPGVASVQQLRQAVEAALGVPAPLQLLQCGTQRLFPDSATLRQCGVRQFSTVNVLMRVCGGIDFQHRDGSKPGSGGVASAQQQAIDRRERLRQLAMETVDLAKGAYLWMVQRGWVA